MVKRILRKHKYPPVQGNAAAEPVLQQAKALGPLRKCGFDNIPSRSEMTQKLGRNDPCPCGSGKKYKHCCGRPEAPATPSADSHDGALERAVSWLAQHHGKALAAALEEEIDGAAFGCFDDGDDDAAREAMAAIDDALWQQLQLNLTEWLLAEGDIKVKGENRRVADLLLGPGGPLLSMGQRAWLEQLAQRPLRLYDVTDVVPGTGITVCDALDTAQAPIVVTEREGSRSIRPGMQIGARVMAVTGGHQVSGAVYPFSMLSGRAMQEALRALLTQPSKHEEDNVLMIGLLIIKGWLAQYLRPAPLPSFVHGDTGEPLLFTTDHYEVQAWPALDAVLAAQPDVHGDRDVGWDRLIECEDGQTRAQVTIAREPGGRRVSLLYKTAALAEQGRRWFETLAGDSVKFLLREVSDPKGLLSHANPSKRAAAQAPSLPAGLDPGVLAEAIAGVVRRSYAHWADEPIPALNGQTPRQAIASAAGLERVKGLLRSYEDGEAQQAGQQGRREISYQFLWDALGLAR